MSTSYVVNNATSYVVNNACVFHLIITL